MRKHKFFVLAAVTALAASMSAHANVVTGSLWIVPEATAQNATIANALAQGAPDVTFTAPSNPLSFSSAGGYTIGDFLASGSATVLTGSAATLGTLMDTNGNGTLMYFTGQVTVTNGQTFTAGHDDGLEFAIGGIDVINQPGPTGFVNTTETYTGPSGTFAFQLAYGECCGPPAGLNIGLPLTSNVPEPATPALVGLAMLGVGLSRRRRA